MSQIGEVLEHYQGVVPSRQGWAKMRCPFHDDNSPSATVNHTTNRYHCFVCGIHEDAVGLVRLQEGGSYADAKRVTEEIAGPGGDRVSDIPDYGGLFPERPRNRAGNGNAVASWRSQFA